MFSLSLVGSLRPQAIQGPSGYMRASLPVPAGCTSHGALHWCCCPIKNIFIFFLKRSLGRLTPKSSHPPPSLICAGDLDTHVLFKIHSHTLLQNLTPTHTHTHWLSFLLGFLRDRLKLLILDYISANFRNSYVGFLAVMHIRF